MIASYRAIIKGRTAEHSKVLHTLAEGSVPALMHCAAGKDRAGISIAVTLLALGVEQEAIEADYLESNSPHRRYKMHRGDAAKPGFDPEVVELISPLFDARAAYLAAALTTIEETWGSVDTYQWTTLLRSLSAYRAFHWAYGGEYTPRKIAHFLILNRACPRSLTHCANQADFHLNRLREAYGEATPAHDRVREILAELSESHIETIIGEGLHEFLGRFINSNAALGRDVADGYLFGPQ